MEYAIWVPLAKFDSSMTSWLNVNVSGQGVSWKVEIGMFEVRVVSFKHKKDMIAFKAVFGL